ncbi:DUF58 domain-containing protein [Flaviflagellibacter deserti]|uniref:DUF58 domain-containing protein n=1 Tax=Flaviflagellibacter deserti TaxID=2267266 RepID=A0ABV9YY16_9HYPH
MVQVRTLDPTETGIGPRHRGGALELAAAMPRLVVAARRTSATVIHGLHGRRRSGTGENFWQFRRFASGESASRVDWRRSARGDHLYVREQEWEAAHTVWIWIDRSRSMNFKSNLAQDSKVERAVILALALADILVRGGERVGLLGLGAPTSSRRAVDILAETLIHAGADEGLPRPAALSPLSEAVLIGDFLEPVDEIVQAVNGIAGRGARGHLMAISDPVEETFPFSGRTEFIEPEGAGKFTFGRAQDLRADYTRRLALHRDSLRDLATPIGWSIALHRTDRGASEALLALHARLAERPEGLTG